MAAWLEWCILLPCCVASGLSTLTSPLSTIQSLSLVHNQLCGLLSEYQLTACQPHSLRRERWGLLHFVVARWPCATPVFLLAATWCACVCVADECDLAVV